MMGKVKVQIDEIKSKVGFITIIVNLGTEQRKEVNRKGIPSAKIFSSQETCRIKLVLIQGG